MLSALIYLQWHSFRNRLVHRITRLKQPKYLVGAFVGGLYFYFYFFRYLFSARGRPGVPGLAVSPEYLPLLESLGALLLLVIVVLAWVIPHERAALAFSEAEVAFLFPAPISRRGLIHFKLVRSQVRVLFSALFLVLLSNRFGGNCWIHAAGWWLVLSMLNLHFLGSSFARTLLLDRGISNWLRRSVVLAGALALATVVTLWARKTVPELNASDTADWKTAAEYLQRILTSGPALYLLAPFRLAARPFLAPDAQAFLRALGPALLLLAAHYIWVVYSNVAFEEASVEASKKLATRIAAVRAGDWQAGRKIRKGKRPWFKLAATGPPATALIWKNLISAGQAVTWRIWFSLSVVCVAFYAGFAGSPHSKDLFPILGIFVAVVLGWSVLVGPQFLRQDFRQDLPLADILKTFPMRGWQVALGEILAPVLLLAAFQWLLLFFAALFLLSARGGNGPLLLAGVAGAAVLVPAADAVLLLIPNAAVLLFPSWMQAGRDGPRGIEATGQRLVFVFGQLLVLGLALLPAAAAFGGVFLLMRWLLGNLAAVPLASAAAAAVLAGEAGLGVFLVGKLFERFDLSAEANP
jgi:hypothetical protein